MWLRKKSYSLIFTRIGATGRRVSNRQKPSAVQLNSSSDILIVKHWDEPQYSYTYIRTCVVVHLSSVHVAFVHEHTWMYAPSLRRGQRGGEGKQAGGGGGRDQRQSGIIVTDRAAPWWARRCIVCHLTNLNQSIISLSPDHQSISSVLHSQKVLCLAARLRLHWPIKCHSTKCDPYHSSKRRSQYLQSDKEF